MPGQGEVYEAALPRPLRLVNKFGGLARRLGLEPRIDGEAILRDAERRLGKTAGRQVALDALSHEGLMVRARSYEAEARLSLMGRILVRSDLTRCVANQLAFERAYLRHPEITQQQIKRPLFVVGLPRSGTTLMQRLLCCHPGARYLPFWEAHEPVPRTPDPSSDDTRRRIAAGHRAVQMLNRVAPSLKRVHPITSETDPEECIHLFMASQLVPHGFDFARLPTYWRWYEALPDRAAPYRMFEKQLQLLQWVESREHWVLKSPIHMTRLAELLQVFPTARIVYMQRDPVQSVASLGSLVALMWSLLSEDVDLDDVGAYVLKASRISQQMAGEALRGLCRDRLVHVDFSRFMSDPVGCALSAYRQLGYRADGGVERAMQEFMVANPRDKHGRHGYSLKSFGLDEEMVASCLKAPGQPVGQPLS